MPPPDQTGPVQAPPPGFRRREWAAAYRHAGTFFVTPDREDLFDIPASRWLLNAAEQIEAGALTPWADTTSPCRVCPEPATPPAQPVHTAPGGDDGHPGTPDGPAARLGRVLWAAQELLAHERLDAAFRDSLDRLRAATDALDQPTLAEVTTPRGCGARYESDGDTYRLVLECQLAPEAYAPTEPAPDLAWQAAYCVQTTDNDMQAFAELPDCEACDGCGKQVPPDFYEPDEPVSAVAKAFAAGPHGRTKRPGARVEASGVTLETERTATTGGPDHDGLTGAPLCRAQYPRGSRRAPGDRIVECGMAAGHGGDWHTEEGTGFTWPTAPIPPLDLTDAEREAFGAAVEGREPEQCTSTLPVLGRTLRCIRYTGHEGKHCDERATTWEAEPAPEPAGDDPEALVQLLREMRDQHLDGYADRVEQLVRVAIDAGAELVAEGQEAVDQLRAELESVRVVLRSEAALSEERRVELDRLRADHLLIPKDRLIGYRVRHGYTDDTTTMVDPADVEIVVRDDLGQEGERG